MEEYEQKSFLKQNSTSVVVVLVIIVFGFLLFKGWGSIINKGIDEMTTVTGNFSCLPLVSGEPVGEEDCNLGLRSRDGSYFALDVTRVQDANTDLKAEDTIAATGIMIPASEAPTSDWAMYDIKGIIQVNSLLRTK
ncbi:MAG: hypothetical protein ABIF06_01490 [bacterium]